MGTNDIERIAFLEARKAGVDCRVNLTKGLLILAALAICGAVARLIA